MAPGFRRDTALEKDEEDQRKKRNSDSDEGSEGDNLEGAKGKEGEAAGGRVRVKEEPKEDKDPKNSWADTMEGEVIVI